MIALALTVMATAATPGHGEPVKLADLADQRVRECSGMAVGRANANIIWVHNDSGDGPHLYATNAAGDDLGRFTLNGIKASDWEDMCSFTRGGGHYLLVGDVGDNRRKRERLSLHLVREPDVTNAAREVEIKQTIQLTFAGGPEDCESVAVDPTDGTVLLITKHRRLQHAKVYSFALPDGASDEVLKLEPIATVPTPLVTAMDVSPDGRRAVVLTMAGVLLFERAEHETWARAFHREPARLTRPTDARQAEAVCYNVDGRSLLLTSEGTPCPLWRVPAENTD